MVLPAAMVVPPLWEAAALSCTVELLVTASEPDPIKSAAISPPWAMIAVAASWPPDAVSTDAPIIDIVPASAPAVVPTSNVPPSN